MFFRSDPLYVDVWIRYAPPSLEDLVSLEALIFVPLRLPVIFHSLSVTLFQLRVCRHHLALLCGAPLSGSRVALHRPFSSHRLVTERTLSVRSGTQLSSMFIY